MNQQSNSGAAEAPRTPGAKRAGPGEYYFDLAGLDPIMGGPDYSSVFGGCVEGERMIIALMRMPAGTGSEPHSHPNEQWVFILEGTMDSVVNGVRRLVRSGSAGAAGGSLRSGRQPTVETASPLARLDLDCTRLALSVASAANGPLLSGKGVAVVAQTERLKLAAISAHPAAVVGTGMPTLRGWTDNEVVAVPTDS